MEHPPISLEPDPADILLSQLRVLEARGQRTPGLVHSRVNFYESYASPHPRQCTLPDSLAAYRRTTKRLRSRGREYGDQLRIAAALNPAERSADLQESLKQHDQLMFMLAQKMKEADKKAKSSQDLLDIAQWRLRYLKLMFSMYRVLDHSEATKSSFGWTCLVSLATGLMDLVRNIMVDTLAALDSLMPRPDEVIEYENVGPDHDLSTLGADISHQGLQTLQEAAKDEADNSSNANDGDRGPLFRCCICLSEYEDPDTAFWLEKCKHVVGRECMDGWLNGTSVMATSCPQCRTLLCQRRPRAPKGQTEDQRREIGRLDVRRDETARLTMAGYGLMNKIRGKRESEEVMERIRCELNAELRRRGVTFRMGALQHAQDGRMGWPIGRVFSDETNRAQEQAQGGAPEGSLGVDRST